MGKSNYKRDDSPEYRYSLTTRNKDVIALCERHAEEMLKQKHVEIVIYATFSMIYEADF